MAFYLSKNRKKRNEPIIKILALLYSVSKSYKDVMGNTKSNMSQRGLPLLPFLV